MSVSLPSLNIYTFFVWIAISDHELINEWDTPAFRTTCPESLRAARPAARSDYTGYLILGIHLFARNIMCCVF